MGIAEKLNPTVVPDKPAVKPPEIEPQDRAKPCYFSSMPVNTLRIIIGGSHREVDILNLAGVCLVFLRHHDVAINTFAAQFPKRTTEEMLQFFGHCPSGLSCRPRSFPEHHPPAHVMEVMFYNFLRYFDAKKYEDLL